MSIKPIDTPTDPNPSDHSTDPSMSNSDPLSASNLNLVKGRLQAWVETVEKDTETQIQEYLEQIDAGQSGE